MTVDRLELGSPALDLLVTVQRGAGKTMPFRLLDGTTNVTEDAAGRVVFDNGTEWVAEVETWEPSEADPAGGATLVIRASDTETDLPAGSYGARLVASVAGDASENDEDRSVLAIGRVVVQ